jgi:hypothetical protein
MPSASEIFEIPEYYYFEAGNDFSGSMGDFAYKIINGEQLHVMTWHGRLCSMKAEIEKTADFDRTEEGFRAMVKWIGETYQNP